MTTTKIKEREKLKEFEERYGESVKTGVAAKLFGMSTDWIRQKAEANELTDVTPSWQRHIKISVASIAKLKGITIMEVYKKIEALV